MDIQFDRAGQVIRRLRKEAKMSQSQLAKRLGWHRGRLSKYESDSVGISLEALEAIADELGLPREELVLRCLQSRYSRLAKSGDPVGDLVRQLLTRLEMHRKST